MPATHQGPKHEWAIWTEAAGNSATLSAISALQKNNNLYTASAGKISWPVPVYLNGFIAVGDVASLTEICLKNSTFSGNRQTISLRQNLPAETSTAAALGWHDFRHCPIQIPADDSIECQWTEDASTNVEPMLAALVSYGAPLPLNPVRVMHKKGVPEAAFDLHVTQTATTAAAWTKSTNVIGPNNADAIPLDENGKYAITNMWTDGSASLKCSQLILGGLDTRPGLIGGVDPNVQPIPVFDPLPYSPILCDGKTLNNGILETYNVDGTVTNVVGLRVRRIA